MHNWAVIYSSKKKKDTNVYKLKQSKISSRKQGHSPTINGLYYTTPNYMKQKKNTSN